ncbi:hypothetical protein TrVE_jg7934 [Triparma verrucosa]|uniref:Uncharacterized protein n=1 Tax=Triparma verrucosa TaxID=1606542 RepID=A0A9W7F7W9_9STRA|nr:hypothetical protein TrVE_jg7934 [Triparma verrucosa]
MALPTTPFEGYQILPPDLKDNKHVALNNNLENQKPAPTDSQLHDMYTYLMKPHDSTAELHVRRAWTLYKDINRSKHKDKTSMLTSLLVAATERLVEDASASDMARAAFDGLSMLYTSPVSSPHELRVCNTVVRCQVDLLSKFHKSWSPLRKSSSEPHAIFSLAAETLGNRVLAHGAKFIDELTTCVELGRRPELLLVQLVDFLISVGGKLVLIFIEIKVEDAKNTKMKDHQVVHKKAAMNKLLTQYFDFLVRYLSVEDDSGEDILASKRKLTEEIAKPLTNSAVGLEWVLEHLKNEITAAAMTTTTNKALGISALLSLCLDSNSRSADPSSSQVTTIVEAFVTLSGCLPIPPDAREQTHRQARFVLEALQKSKGEELHNAVQHMLVRLGSVRRGPISLHNAKALFASVARHLPFSFVDFAVSIAVSAQTQEHHRHFLVAALSQCGVDHLDESSRECLVNKLILALNSDLSMSTRISVAPLLGSSLRASNAPVISKWCAERMGDAFSNVSKSEQSCSEFIIASRVLHFAPAELTDMKEIQDVVIEFCRKHCSSCQKKTCNECLVKEEGIETTLFSVMKNMMILEKSKSRENSKSSVIVTSNERACWFMIAQLFEAAADVLALLRTNLNSKVLGHSYAFFAKVFSSLRDGPLASPRLIEFLGLSLANVYRNHFNLPSLEYTTVKQFLLVAKLLRKIEGAPLLKSAFYELYQSLEEDGRLTEEMKKSMHDVKKKMIEQFEIKLKRTGAPDKEEGTERIMKRARQLELEATRANRPTVRLKAGSFAIGCGKDSYLISSSAIPEAQLSKIKKAVENSAKVSGVTGDGGKLVGMDVEIPLEW